MRLTSFRNDSLGYDSFEVYTKNENWNGWDCPYFTYEQAQKVLKAYNQIRQIIGETNLAYYDPETDAFIFPNSEDKEIFRSMYEEGRKYYPIGAFSWIWESNESDFLENTLLPSIRVTN